MKNIIFLCGLYNIGFALFHIGFWRIFNWKKDLQKLNFANKAIMQIFNVQGIYYFFSVAFICFYYPNELQKTSLGRVFLITNALFWVVRAINQVIFLPMNNRVVNLLTIIFILGIVLFAMPLVS